jgi:hypothetical protein
VGAFGDVTYVVGPLIIVLVIGALALVLRWAYRPGGSLIAKPSRSGKVTDYGLLVAVASPGSYVEGEISRQRLEEAGVRATLAMTQDGPRVMVFPGDEQRARKVLTRKKQA